MQVPRQIQLFASRRCILAVCMVQCKYASRRQSSKVKRMTSSTWISARVRSYEIALSVLEELLRFFSSREKDTAACLRVLDLRGSDVVPWRAGWQIRKQTLDYWVPSIQLFALDEMGSWKVPFAATKRLVGDWFRVPKILIPKNLLRLITEIRKCAAIISENNNFPKHETILDKLYRYLV